MSFETKLAKGEFCIPECRECNKTVWPPAKFCSHCFGDVFLREGNFEGKIIEFSQKDDRYFCIVEFEETMRIIASISQEPTRGQIVKISGCGIKDGSYFFSVI